MLLRVVLLSASLAAAVSSGAVCRANIASGGLPQRGELLLARERRSFASMAGRLGSEERLTSEALVEALTSKVPGRAYTAAFLSGRCKTEDAAADQALTDRLRRVVESSAEPDVAIEAAMSLALRGGPDRGREALRRLVQSPSILGDSYKAAFYLAQMGDPSGYGALVRTLQSEVPHYRAMALRHAAAFVPYDGRRVGDLVVDVRQLLVDRLGDADELVRAEVPFYLEELQVADLHALLERVAERDESESVRTAARMVLERNPVK